MLKIALTLAGLVLAALLVPAAAATADDASGNSRASAERRACTRDAAGRCIKRGQACPAAKRGKVGFDNRGRKNVCRPNASGALRWQKPATNAKPKPPSRRCDPNYSGGCVPIASDVDCAGGSGNGPAYVRGPVYVVGDDIYDLDRDGDGVACD